MQTLIWTVLGAMLGAITGAALGVPLFWFLGNYFFQVDQAMVIALSVGAAIAGLFVIGIAMGMGFWACYRVRS
ncbi:hypothetical protein VST7929_01164 [Vibrio stylophorae]|uniref:Uncharacterized protein n=1 Tax=Vibrio stylophorae TaxID=659351 RepID=A0ABN8DRC7_9VIBR|nr:hypothetical protein [Vibrio stylophorae]CAH0533300.1 hypothetical protein VST7929_01164 [Vibrio stylophorae]